jgi:hypothetical protein
MPLPAPLSASKAACVLPLLVGPRWATRARGPRERARGNQEAGEVRSVRWWWGGGGGRGRALDC